MKIAILHAGDLDTLAIGGVDRYVKSLIEYFNDGEITVFGTGKFGKDEIGVSYDREYHGKKYTFIPISLDKRRPLSMYYVIGEYKNMKKFSEYDCLYAQRTELSIPFLYNKNKKKLIQIIHGSNKYSLRGFGSVRAKIHLILEKLSIGIARKTFVILNREEFGVPYYKKSYPKYAERIKYARNPINPQMYYHQDKATCRNELRIKPNETVVVYVGRLLNVSKRVLLIPKIAKVLKDRGCEYKFVILGEGPDREKMETLISEFQLKDSFRLEGYVDDTQKIAKYYNAADVAINISAYEGTCTSNLETLCCGTPLVATDVGDIREVLDGTHNGIIVPNIPNEEQLVIDIADSIEKVINTPPKMNDAYLKYSGTEVAAEIRNEMVTL